MRFPRYRLRWLMGLVLVSALLLGAGVEIAKMGPVDLAAIRDGAVFVVPFLIFVALKLALVVSVNRRRTRAEPGEARPGDELSSY